MPMFLMRPYLTSRRYLRYAPGVILLAVAFLGVITTSCAQAANTDAIVQPLGTSHGNSEVLVMPNSVTYPDHSNEPEEKPAQPDTSPPGSSQSFSSLIDILQNKPKIEATAPEATTPEPLTQATPAPTVKPPEPPPAPPLQKLSDERAQQPTTQTPFVPRIDPKDLLPVPYNNRGSGPK
jgi:hypothetical protein